MNALWKTKILHIVWTIYHGRCKGYLTSSFLLKGKGESAIGTKSGKRNECRFTYI